MKDFLKRRKLDLICTAGCILVLCTVWVIAYYCVKNDYIIPSFSQTMGSFFACFAEGKFWISVLNTLLRCVISALVSIVLAVACSAGACSSKIFASCMRVFISVIRTLPTLAVILILLIWTNARIAPVIVTVLVLFPLMYSQIMTSVDGVDKGVLQMAEVYGVSKKDKLLKIYLPQVSVGVFAQAGANFSLGLKVMVSAEVMASTYNSLGGLMQSARAFLEMPRLSALTIVTVILGLVIELALSQLKRINGKWL